ncbi:MAG: secondary thiamine-phosphate synthase enzyme YjbQ [Clostridiales bacterium]|nr:secondary thiamine-phosphate synthase enzyme YjbQ [Clostridiales bacterium]
MVKKVRISTKTRSDMVNITGRIQEIVAKSGIKNGIVVVFVPHTTAGITINENADPDVVTDILMKLNKIVTEDRDYLHYEGNSSAHIKALMTGSSVTVILEEGKLALGMWQGIYFCEYDGPRSRTVNIEIIAKGG